MKTRLVLAASVMMMLGVAAWAMAQPPAAEAQPETPAQAPADQPAPAAPSAPAAAQPAAQPDAPADLKVGDAAPDFVLKDDTGAEWKAADHYGKSYVVVYFYPAATTRGCTTQACAFRDNMEALKAKGIEVVGVSGDDVAGLQLFKLANNLNFALLSDFDGGIAKKFGVPVRAGGTVQATVNDVQHTLTRGVSASRWTFVVDKDKKVIMKNVDVDPAQDSKSVMELVDRLAAPAAPAAPAGAAPPSEPAPAASGA
jgi:peroxiredoxin Q/BCP